MTIEETTVTFTELTADLEIGDRRDDWRRTAVVYQVYPRSFADSDGDGIGDLPGITGRLGALAELGVDAVWLSPFYKSPQADAGYDVADYRDVDPIFGTLADFDALLERAHELGLKVIVDLVPNHSSDEHVWFQAALAAAPGLARARAVHLPRRPRRERRTAAEQLGVLLPRTGLDPHHQRGRHPRPVVPAPVRHQAAGLGLGEPGGPGRVPRRAAVLAGPRRRRLPGRRRPLADQGARACRIIDKRVGRRPRAPTPRASSAPARCGTRTGCTRSTRRGGRCSTPTPPTGSWSPRPGCSHCPGWPATSATDEMHQAFNFDYLETEWDAAALRTVDRRVDDRATSRSARRPPGCCPTTTSCATSRGSAWTPTAPGRTASAPRTCSPTTSSGCAGRGRRRC